VSACEPHRSWIETQLQLGRNAMSLYQDLVELHGFTHGYNSVKRFVAKLKEREPKRFDVPEYLPAEECQVDFGQGALTRLRPEGRYRRPFLFVMTLKYSGKSFRKTVWKADQETWCRLHEEAWRSFGGCTRYVVLDNLRQGVIKPDIYDPELNPVYAAVPAPLHSRVKMRIYAREIEIFDASGQVLRRHAKAARKGQFVLAEGDRIFNPPRETARLLGKAAKIGPQTEALGQLLFATRGRPGHKALYGLTNLPRTFRRADIEAVCARFLASRCLSYRAIRKALERRAEASTTPQNAPTQAGPDIRPMADYQAFWEAHARDERTAPVETAPPRANASDPLEIPVPSVTQARRNTP